MNKMEQFERSFYGLDEKIPYDAVAVGIRHIRLGDHLIRKDAIAAVMPSKANAIRVTLVGGNRIDHMCESRILRDRTLEIIEHLLLETPESE